MRGLISSLPDGAYPQVLMWMFARSEWAGSGGGSLGRGWRSMRDSGGGGASPPAAQRPPESLYLTL